LPDPECLVNLKKSTDSEEPVKYVQVIDHV
jgi:hypothetical protein